MKESRPPFLIRCTCVWLTLGFLVLGIAHAASYPMEVLDASGNPLHISERPMRVVSLVPSATEILFSIGCQDAVAGITHHDTRLPGAQEKTIAGGFFSPSLKRIEEMKPDLLIVAPLHTRIREHFEGGACRVLVFDTRTLEEGNRNIRMLGRVFDRESEAEAIIGRNDEELAVIRAKVERISKEKRKRVIRLMGRDEVMTPGDDSFQNELIAAAGGIPPKLGKTGAIVPVSLEEWQRFNPQVIYGCGGGRETPEAFFSRPGWKEVEGVKNGQVRYFPCDLTCRAATHTGYFVSWLASVIYCDEFAVPQNRVRPQRVLYSRPIEVDLPYVRSARVAYSTQDDFLNKTLIIDFASPQSVVSTLEGHRKGITTVGNHFSPPPCWCPGHRKGLKKVREEVYRVIGRSQARTSCLFTGADMDNLAVKQEAFKEMRVYALVTAGAESNAVRMSRDSGDYYEPGTINILILTNMALSPRAMTRAIVSATEAKIAALWDMDIRSSYTPLVHGATGTGTDNIIVVQGEGRPIDGAGGHTKMGELIASAVYAGVQEALLKQNGLQPKRDVFKRMEERRISIHSLLSKVDCECKARSGDWAGAVEEILLDPRYGSFLESALALSDAYERGLVHDLEAFHQWCLAVAKEVAQKEVGQEEDLVRDLDLPMVIRSAVNAVLTGAKARMEAR
jgi:ABC-type Fe3+-hydroxamate transport system substrate-binding protein/adenosylcobinamide amidohydrolase